MRFKRGEEVLVLAERSPESIKGIGKGHYITHYLVDNSVALVTELLNRDQVRVYGVCVEEGYKPAIRSQVVHRSQIKLI